jgi:SHS2 domain-containing protein
MSGKLGTLALTETGRYRLIEHTADMGIEAWGASREAVLLAMARGLRDMTYGDSPAAEEVAVDISVTAADPVELLVAWLNEIAYRCESADLVPAGCRIVSLSEVAVRGVLSAAVFDAARHVVERQVKSVTYHNACFEKIADGWHARVYVDL